MKKELFDFEKRLEDAIKDPKRDPILYYSETIKRKYYDWRSQQELYRIVRGRPIPHWYGYLDKLFANYNLTAEETYTAYLYYAIFEPNNYDWLLYDCTFVKEFHRVYDGMKIIPMSDKEFEYRFSEKENDYLYFDLNTLVKAYLYGKDIISKDMILKIHKYLPMDEDKVMYTLEGPIAEEIKYEKDKENLDCESSSIYTYSNFDRWDDEEVNEETYGWKCFSQVEGFEEAFNKFIENFKKSKMEEYDKKLNGLLEDGIKSRLVLKEKVEGFKTIEII